MRVYRLSRDGCLRLMPKSVPTQRTAKITHQTSRVSHSHVHRSQNSPTPSKSPFAFSKSLPLLPAHAERRTKIQPHRGRRDVHNTSITSRGRRSAFNPVFAFITSACKPEISGNDHNEAGGRGAIISGKELTVAISFFLAVGRPYSDRFCHCRGRLRTSIEGSPRRHFYTTRRSD